MSGNEAEERTRFETWAVGHLGDDRYLLRDEQHPDSYDAYLMDHLWLCWQAARAAPPVSAPVTLDQAREWRRINWYDSVPEMLDKALAAFANYAANGVDPVSDEKPTLQNPAAAPSVASEDSATQPEQLGTCWSRHFLGDPTPNRKALTQVLHFELPTCRGWTPVAASQLSTEKK